MTVGDDALTVGVDDEPAVAEDEATDEPPLTTAGVVVELEPDVIVAAVPVLLPVLLDPEWPWDTAIPMATVAPVAAITAPRVR